MTFDRRTVELIAIGASVAVNCQPCLKYHTDKALEVGITEQEIKEAIEVGRTVKKGAAHHMDKFIASQHGESPKASCQESGCCSS
jgi:AhpD family alkylhydroperoxidase